MSIDLYQTHICWNKKDRGADFEPSGSRAAAFPGFSFIKQQGILSISHETYRERDVSPFSGFLQK